MLEEISAYPQSLGRSPGDGVCDRLGSAYKTPRYVDTFNLHLKEDLQSLTFQGHKNEKK